MRSVLTVTILSVVACSRAFAGDASTTAGIDAGKQTFGYRCAECHAPGFGHPGTQQLGWTRGEKLALLEARTDLTADYVAFVVRNGLLEMPPFRPTEIDDAELRQLADYLGRGRK